MQRTDEIKPFKFSSDKSGWYKSTSSDFSNIHWHMNLKISVYGCKVKSNGVKWNKEEKHKDKDILTSIKYDPKHILIQPWSS